MQEENKNIIFFDPQQSPAKIHGLIAGEYNRVPADVRALMSDGLRDLSCQTSGGRIRFNTNSDILVAHVEVLNEPSMAHMPSSGSAGLDIFEGTGKEMKYIATRQPDCGKKRLDAEVSLAKGEKTLTLYLPLYNGVHSLQIGLAAGATLTAPPPYRRAKPLVFYGSSITQGGCASRPANSYCAMVARYLDSDFINLGFSGGAKGEPFMADHIAGLDMSCFIMDYDHNAPTPEHLQKTHLPFLQTILAKQPELPVVILSKPDTTFTANDLARRDIIKASYNRLRAEHYDVHFIDGGDLFGTDFRDSCTVDGTHPNDLGYYRMAQVVKPVLAKALGL